MRIHYASSSWIPSTQANSVHVMKMCSAFSRCGHDVTLFTRKGPGVLANCFESYGVEQSFSLIRAPGSRLPWVGGLLSGVELLTAMRKVPPPDLIYGRHIYTLLLSAHRAPFIYEAHDIHPRRGVLIAIERLLTHRNFRRLVAISQALRADLLRIFPRLPPSMVTVAPDASDEAPPSVTGLGSWPGRSGVTQFGYVGHLYPGKGMEVVAHLARELPGYDFHVIGGRPTDVLAWKSRVTSENLHFHGHVQHAMLGSYYANLDIALAPLQRRVALHDGLGDISRWTSPLKIFEYMAHGRPILASNLPVLREVLTDGANAILVEPDNFTQWVTEARRLASDSQLRRTLSEQAREEFLEKYTWRRRATRVLEGVGLAN